MKNFDKVIDEWRRKCDDLSAELDASQHDSRNLSTDLFKAKASLEEANDQVSNFDNDICRIFYYLLKLFTKF